MVEEELDQDLADETKGVKRKTRSQSKPDTEKSDTGEPEPDTEEEKKKPIRKPRGVKKSKATPKKHKITPKKKTPRRTKKRFNVEAMSASQLRALIELQEQDIDQITASMIAESDRANRLESALKSAKIQIKKKDTKLQKQ